MAKTRLTNPELPESRNGKVVIDFFARLEFAAAVTAWETAAALERFHVLRTEVVRERFEYDEAPGLHLGVVRIYRLQPRWIFADKPGYGGCRSWVNLPILPVTTLQPVLSDREHHDRMAQVKAILADCGG